MPCTVQSGWELPNRLECHAWCGLAERKKERVCGTFAQAHTPTPSPLEGPYKTTLHKNGGAREKRAYVWELCLGTHVPNSSKRALVLAVSLSNSFGPEVALTLLF